MSTTFLHKEKLCTITTPLQCAIKKKTFCLAWLLLKQGADPNQIFRYVFLNGGTSIKFTNTPLELASEMDMFPLVRLLVDEYGVKVPGAFPPDQEVSIKKIPLCQPLISAIEKNNLSLVRYFVESKGVRLNHINSPNFEWNEKTEEWDGTTLWNYDNGTRVDEGKAVIDENDFASYLSYTSWPQNIKIEVVACLLDFGAAMNFNDMDNSGSPLLGAIRSKRMDLVALFVARGADPSLAHDDDNESPVMAAARDNNLQMASMLVAAGGTVLGHIHNFYFEPMARGIESMLEWGLTALDHFATHGNAEGVALMVQEGAEIDSETLSGMTPILSAVNGVDNDASSERIAAACACVRLLIDEGADVNHVRELAPELYEFDPEDHLDVRKTTRFAALTFAVELNAPALVRCLIELGANFTLCTEHSFSLLMRAANKGHFEVLAILVEAAQDLSQKSKAAFLGKKYLSFDNATSKWNGRTALAFSLKGIDRNNRARCAKILTDGGAE